MRIPGRIIDERDGSKERDILTGMIVSDTVLSRIASHYDGNLFQSQHSNAIAKLCVRFHEKYGKAPREQIQSLIERWSRGKDNSTITAVETLLVHLSGNYERLQEELNTDYILDAAAEHFNSVRVKRLTEDIDAHLSLGCVVDAMDCVTKYNRVDIGASARKDPFTDPTLIRKALSKQDHEALVTYPGALSSFFGTTLERDGFIVFAGPMKSGKTFWLLDVAYRALLARRKVAFFEVGDLSENQLLGRIATRTARHPLRSKDGKWPCVVPYPKEIKPPPKIGRSDGEKSFVPADVTHENRTYDGPLTPLAAVKACERFMQKDLKSSKSHFGYDVRPNFSVTVLDIETTLNQWEREGFRPDVVIIDYADLLSPVQKKLEPRDQTNMTWKYLRALSEKKHILLVTATQTNAKSLNADVLLRSHFSEDIRKLAHVTGMVGINVVGREKERKLCRLNWITARDRETNPYEVVHCAQCLPLANPCILSTW